MTADTTYRDKGRFKKGHPGVNQHTKPQPPPDTSDTDTDFDAAILQAAQQFGRAGGKAKVGLAGYCATLRDTRPQDYAALVAKALSRRQLAQQSSAAAVPITVEFVTCPPGYFLPPDEARALWVAKTGGGPKLVIDNATPGLTLSDDDDSFSDDPDDAG